MTGAASGSPEASRAACARPAVEPAYDLLIAGGRVVDPSQGLAAVRDLAIAGGKVSALAADIPPEQARQAIDARGRIVTPGLIDLHGHVYDHGITISVDPDLVGVARGVTTIVDGGSTGATTVPGFRKYVIERAETSVYALLNIAAIGLVVTNELFLDPRIVDPEAAIRVIEENRDRILGIKVRVRGRREGLAADLEALRRAREAADAVRLPIMMHWSNEPELLDLLRPGDTADVSVLDVTNEPIDLVDSNGDVRTGAQQLRPVATVKSGRLVMTQGIDIG